MCFIYALRFVIARTFYHCKTYSSMGAEIIMYKCFVQVAHILILRKTFSVDFLGKNVIINFEQGFIGVQEM